MNRAGIEQITEILAGFGALYSDPGQFPAASRTAWELRFNQPSLGHTDGIFCDINGRALADNMVASRERIPIPFFSFEFWVSECFRVTEEVPKRLREFVVFLNQRLIIYLF